MKFGVNKIFKIAISFLTILAILLSTVIIQILAVNNYGTVDAGITGGGAVLKSFEPIKEFTNGDFSEGFKYWAGRDNSNLTDVVTKKDDNGNNYVEFKYTVGSTKANVGMVSVPFKIDSIKVGDYIGLRVKYRNRVTYSGATISQAPRIAILQGDYDNGNWLAAGWEYGYHSLDTVSTWTTKICKAPGAQGLQQVVSASGTKGIYFTVCISTGAGENAGVAYDFDIDTIEILKFKDSTGTSYDVIGGVEPDTVGTVDGGIKADGITMQSFAPVDGFPNGKFEEGLKYWGGRTHSNPAIVASKKEESGNKYLNFKYDFDASGTDGEIVRDVGIATVPFKIDGIKAGDYVGVKFKYRNEINYEEMGWYQTASSPVIMLYQGGLTDYKAGCYQYGSHKLQYSSTWVTKVTTDSGVGLVAVTAPSEGQEIFFMLSIRVKVDANVNKLSYDFDIDNIEFVKFNSSNPSEGYTVIGKVLDENAYGTKEEGIKADAPDVLELPAVSKLTNGDFEEGLKYWGGRGNTNPGDVVSIKKDNENSYLNFKFDTTDVGTANGIVSVPFKVKGVTAGDYVGVRFKYRNRIDYSASGSHYLKNAAPKIMLTQGNYKDNWLAGCYEYGYHTLEVSPDWRTKVTKDCGIGLIPVSNPGASGEIFFMLSIYTGATQSIESVSYDFDIDDIEFVVFHDESAAGYDVIGEAGYANHYGTQAEGMQKDAGEVIMVPKLKEIKNTNFSNGLKYWGGIGIVGPTSVATIKKDGDNSYLNFKYNTTQVDKSVGIISAPFKIPGIKVGDYVGVRLKYKNRVDYTNGDVNLKAAAPKIMLSQGSYNGNYKSGNFENGIQSLPKTESNWTSLVADDFGTGLIAVDTPMSGQEIFFMLSISTGATKDIASVSYDFDIDDIEIIVFSDATGENYEVLSNNFDDKNPYGTVTQGIVQSKDPRNLAVMDTPKNLDFSEGLKYWGSSMTNFRTTDVAAISYKDENPHLQLSHDATYDGHGIYSAPFYLDVPDGTRLSLLYKWKGNSAMIVRLLQKYGDEEWEWTQRCDGTPASGSQMPVVGETEDDWNISWGYVNSTVKKYSDRPQMFSIYISDHPQLGNGDWVTDVDDLQLVRVEGMGEYARFFTLDTGEEIILDTYDEEDIEQEEENDVADIESSDANVNNNIITEEDINANNSLLGIDYSINMDRIMKNIEKLKSGEKIDFIILFNVDSSNGGINVYVPVNLLSAAEKESLISMSRSELEKKLNQLQSTLNTIGNAPNSESVKIFNEFGGNPATTLPFSFNDSVYIGFTVNIRIKIAKGVISPENTYYAYQCDASIGQINGIGKAYIEETDENTYITITTDTLSDIYIAINQLKAKNINNDIESSALGIGWIVVISVTAFVLVVGGVTFLIIFFRKRREG